MTTHKELYELASKISEQHRHIINLICEIEIKKYGFEFAQTDNDEIIDTLNYGTSKLSFDAYTEIMKDHKKDKRLRKY